MNLDVTGVDADRRDGGLRLYVNWTMRCSRLPKGRCVGKLEVVPPSKKFAVQVFPKDGVVSCKGLCQQKRSKGRERVDLGFRGLKTDRDFWSGQSFYIRFETFCKSGSRFIPNGTQSATIAFDETGALDVVQSDRNANGTPDGDEKRP